MTPHTTLDASGAVLRRPVPGFRGTFSGNTFTPESFV